MTQGPQGPDGIAPALSTALWTVALAAGLLWPARSFSMFDGAPLDGRWEAIVIGVVVPALWWLNRTVLRRTWMRSLIAALLLTRVLGLFLAQEGLCARFYTSAPFEGEVQTIPIVETRGVLRSWDVRADWRAEAPSCTAIIDRSYGAASEFPVWFLNVLDFIRPGRRDLSLAVTGVITVRNSGTFTLQTGEDMAVSGHIADRDVAGASPRDINVPLTPGSHAVDLHAKLTGDRWRFAPLWNGEPAWRSAVLTVSAPGGAWRPAAATIAAITTAIVSAIVIGWAFSALAALNLGAAALAWTVGASALLVAMAITGRFERMSGALLLAAVFVPVAAREQTVRSAFVLLGVPWLAFFAARSAPQIAHVTAYSADDWLTYQAAGYRIFMNGYWLEAGSKTFDYQPLYRWITGALHLVFGDSSVGETFLDAASLLAGALLAFTLTRAVAGFRAAIFAAAGALATFTLGTTWYFVGRGLSETAAAGFAFLAAAFLLDARLGKLTSALAAGFCAVLMFYTRLNHLLFAIFLLALLLPPAASASASGLVEGLRGVRLRAAAIYCGVFAAGVAVFAARTWWYTGVFGLFYGTSLKNNDTGLRPAAIASPAVWRKVGHSLASLVWMNEPPRLDVRAILVAAGVACAVLAAAQIPVFRRLPASLVIVTLGAMVSALFVHTHNYPGRMSLHLIPFAVAVAVSGVTMLRRRDAASTPGHSISEALA